MGEDMITRWEPARGPPRESWASARCSPRRGCRLLRRPGPEQHRRVPHRGTRRRRSRRPLHPGGRDRHLRRRNRDEDERRLSGQRRPLVPAERGARRSARLDCPGPGGCGARLRGLPAAARLGDERLQPRDGGQPDGRAALRARLVDRARGPARLRALRAVRAAHRRRSRGGAGCMPVRRPDRGLNRHRDRLRRGLRRGGRGDRRLGAPIRPHPGGRSRARARGARGRRLRPPCLGQRPVSVHQRPPGPVHPQRLLRRRARPASTRSRSRSPRWSGSSPSPWRRSSCRGRRASRP